MGLTQKSIEMTDNVPKCDTFVAYDISPTFYIYAGREPDYRFFATQNWAIENGPSLRQKVVDCYRSGLAEWILVYQYGQSNIKGALDENYELYRYDEKYGLSRNLVGINFRHPNVMPNFAVWKTITYRHWHRWCCQPRF